MKLSLAEMESSVQKNIRVACVLITVCCLSALLMAGCRKGSVSQRGKIVVGFSQIGGREAWRVDETESIRDEAAKRADKFELMVADAGGEASKQVSDVKDLIARGADVIFLAGADKEGMSPAVLAAKQANVPLFLIGSKGVGTVTIDFITTIQADSVEQGGRAAEWLAKQSNVRAGIVELNDSANSLVADDCMKGFSDEIGKHALMKFVASETVNAPSRAEEAQKLMRSIIEAHGKEMTAVYAHNAELALGAIQALKEAGKRPGTDVLIIATGAERPALEAIGRGEINIAIECHPRFGAAAFDALERYLSGEKMGAPIIAKNRFFDSSNASEYLKKE